MPDIDRQILASRAERAKRISWIEVELGERERALTDHEAVAQALEEIETERGRRGNGS